MRRLAFGTQIRTPKNLATRLCRTTQLVLSSKKMAILTNLQLVGRSLRLDSNLREPSGSNAVPHQEEQIPRQGTGSHEERRAKLTRIYCKGGRGTESTV